MRSTPRPTGGHLSIYLSIYLSNSNNNNNWLQHPPERIIRTVPYAWFLWGRAAGPAYMGTEVSQALYRPYPPNPSPLVNVYKLLNMFQASTIGVLSEVASPYLVPWYGMACRYLQVRYGTVYGTIHVSCTVSGAATVFLARGIVTC